jgi:ABC-2 type transport system ATP-binding protein
MTGGVPAICIENLSYIKTHEWTRKKIPILKHIQLDVNEGECFGFLGHNGAGKTTTIKSILGLITPTTGTIRIFGEDNTQHQARRSLGYIAEQPYFYDYLTVEEILSLYSHLCGIERRTISTVIDRMLQRVKLEHKKKVKLRTLSKGQLQRVALAQAIIASPKLLILDEPFSGLDPIGRREFKDIFLSCKQEGITTFICSHVLNDIEFLCDRVSIMAHGELKGIYDISDIIAHSNGTYQITVKPNNDEQRAFLKEGVHELKEDKIFYHLHFKEQEAAEKMLKMILEKKISIDSYRFVNGTLEELFLKVIEGENVKE